MAFNISKQLDPVLPWMHLEQYNRTNRRAKGLGGLLGVLGVGGLIYGAHKWDIPDAMPDLPFRVFPSGTTQRWRQEPLKTSMYEKVSGLRARRLARDLF